MKYFHLLLSLSNIVAEFVELIKELQNNSNFDFIFKNFDSSALIVDYNLHHYARFEIYGLQEEIIYGKTALPYGVTL